MAPQDIIAAIQYVADKAAEKGVEIEIELHTFGANGSVDATIKATPVKKLAEIGA